MPIFQKCMNATESAITQIETSLKSGADCTKLIRRVN